MILSLSIKKIKLSEQTKLTKDKMNALFKKSQEIVNLMNKLEIQKYHGYSVTDTAAENFLVLSGISITSSLFNTYLGNDLSKFIPRTAVEIMEKF